MAHPDGAICPGVDSAPGNEYQGFLVGQTMTMTAAAAAAGTSHILRKVLQCEA